jgi:vitamin B12 transporter
MSLLAMVRVPSVVAFIFPFGGGHKNERRFSVLNMRANEIRQDVCILLILICLLTILLVPYAKAQSSQVTETITVEGRRIEERLSAELEEYGHQVEIIPGEILEQGGFVDINQALETLVPGLYIATKSGRGDYTNAPLHGSTEILWLLDGVRLNNRLYGQGYLDSISVKMIERIEVVKGGQGLFYGTDSAGGVVNIITKPVTTEISGQVGAFIGDGNYLDAYGHVSNSFGGHGLMAFGSYENWHGYEPFESDVYRRTGNTDPEDRAYDRTVAGGKYRKELELAGLATLNIHFQRNMGEFDFARPNEKMAVNDRTEDIAFLKWDHDINKAFSYYLKTYIHRWWTDYTRQALDGTYLYKDSEWGYQDAGANLMGSWRFGGHEILLGGDYQNYWARDEVWHIADTREEVWAGFAQFRPHFAFAPRAQSAMGVRHNKTGGNEKTIWNISLRTPIVGDTYFRGVVGTSFALPTAEQLYLDEDGSYGNPDLKPEESFNVDMGFGGKFSIFTWDVGYFYQEIEDAISYTADWVTFENADGKTEVDGFEAQLGVDLTAGFKLFLSGTKVDAHLEDDDAQLEYRPEYTAKCNLSYRHPSTRFGTDLNTRYVGELYSRYTDANGEPVEYGKYYVVDVSGFFRFGKENRHRVTLRLDNVFDEDYTWRLYPTEDVATGETFLYDYKTPGFLATLGYSYSF